MQAIFLIDLVWLLWALIWFSVALWVGPTIKRASIWHEVLYRIVMIFGFVLLFGFYSSGYEVTHRLWDPLRGPLGWLMLGLVGMGLGVSLWARLVLGPLWSGSITRKSKHHIVMAGPYAVVRHPIYSATMLAAFATAFATGTPTSFLGVLVMIFGWFIKARLEERFLREELGPGAYDAYALKVPMFVPYGQYFFKFFDWLFGLIRWD